MSSSTSGTGVRDMVLIHGAWQGSWAFEAWRPLLEAAGWRVHGVDLPGNGHTPASVQRPATLAGYTDHVCDVLNAIARPAVVLGHSGGGMVASQVAEALPDQVAALVYLVGMMLPSGMSYSELIAQARRDDPGWTYVGIGPHLNWSADRSSSQVSLQGALETFVHDCPAEAARAAAARLRPQPESGRAIAGQLSVQRFGRVPRLYVACRKDRSVPWALQQRMLRLQPPQAQIVLDCGHVPQLACPAALTQALLPALEVLLA
ncbi:alpha/beta fold hydrolase [Pantoea sp. 18069]|uniref:alpha/beta fold hydrolase n=1 Tax=Pantoea sp. 18069 TaxID=2681415 RepID=UPI00190F8A38|nr:alpha/beta hydrolase [Pantoea sp. 18069]